MSYSDGEEGWDGLAELPHDASHAGPSSMGSAERNVKRRSSKACDQCRKCKCKCERPNLNKPCNTCITAGTPCTFLGPSRKRGPPKGYIDAIEARLHQTEALLGIMLATTDRRAKSLLNDIAQDPLAKEIINRVDNSPYGVKGRKGEDVAVSVGKAGSTSGQGTDISSNHQANPDSVPDLRTTHPSNEWQDRVVTMIKNLSSSLPQDYNSPKSEVSEGSVSPTSRRQRRRVGTEDHPLRAALEASKSASASAASLQESPSSTTSWYQTPRDFRPSAFSVSGSVGRTGKGCSSIDSEALDTDSEEELLSAVGQLSINEDEQIRYHGKASGIYLLGKKERLDQRNEGGIWRFPRARVWPNLPPAQAMKDTNLRVELPPKEVQEHLLNLYFTYVHPFLPIVHKQSFINAFRDGPQVHMESDQLPKQSNQAVHSRRRDIPVLLLLAMFACASRYDSITPLPSDPSIMWPAGDEYLESAKVVLNSTDTSSRPATVQALLLLGYREAGIGDMSLAWTYVGMSIRMAQDLGMHRLADGWKRSGLGGRLFSEWELAERKRIWFGCVVLDKFISAIIGRPIMIFESDFDTLLPSVDDLEENEEWSVEMALGERSSPAPGRIISCFNAIAVLFGIFGKVMQSLYAVRPTGNQHTEAAILESALDKWYLELPDHLQCELVNTGSSCSVSLSSKQRKPLPNVLALHLYYWTTVLILHRSFIAHLLHRKEKHTDHEDPGISRSYELCRTAAIRVASLTSLYQDTYLFQRCSPLLIYCLFSSSILLDADMARHPGDPQARFSFSKSTNGLGAMGIVWPSAGRALALFTGAKAVVVDNSMIELIQSSTTRENSKRAAEEELDESFDNRTSSTVLDTVAHPRPSQVPQYAPKPHISVPSMGNLQRRYSQPHQGRHASVEVFTGGQPLTGPLIPSPSSPLLSGLVDPSYMQDASAFGAQLSTAVIPHLYSSGFLDDVEGRIHGMQSQPPQDFQFYRGTFPLPSHLHPPQMLSPLGHYDLQESAQPFSSHLQHLHGLHHPQHPQQQRQHPRMGPIRPTNQQHSDVYLPHRFNLYTTYD